MAKNKDDWKERLGVVYSTNQNFDYDVDKGDEQKTLPPKQQNLKVMLDKRNRKGKAVTLVTNFIGQKSDLKELGRNLKSKCGVGGSVKNSQIIIQGDFRDRIMELLKTEGYKVKKSGR